MRLSHSRVAFALALGIASTPASAWAGEEIVYRPLVTDGTEYRRVSYPEEAGPLLVLAGTDIVLEARRAPVSYWPITREFLPDLAKASEPLAGSVEMVGPSGAVTVAETETFVMWHPDGVGAGPAELIRGEAASDIYEDYVREGRAAAARLNEYQQMVARQRALMESWLVMAAERRGRDLPPPPPELTLEAPTPYRAFATEPEEAAILTLPAGRYTIRIRGDDGQIVPGSERRLISFGPVQEGVGYVIRPQDRWTQPSVSFAPDEVIYTTGRTDLFLQPVSVMEFRADLFTRLFRPQSVEAADPAMTMWVPRSRGGIKPEGLALALWNDGDRIETAAATGFRVAQLAGSRRGYTIEEFTRKPNASLEPDFTAMRIDSSSPATRLVLVEGQDGDPLPGGVRRIRSIRPPPDALVFLPAFLPLVIGLALRAVSARRRGRRRA